MAASQVILRFHKCTVLIRHGSVSGLDVNYSFKNANVSESQNVSIILFFFLRCQRLCGFDSRCVHGWVASPAPLVVQSAVYDGKKGNSLPLQLL